MNSNDHLLKLGHTNIEASLALATLSIDGAGRLLNRHIEFAKTLLAENGKMLPHTFRADVASDPAQFARACEKQFETLLQWAQNCVEITVQTQAEISQLVRNQMQELARQPAEEQNVAVEVLANGEEEALPAKPKKRA